MGWLATIKARPGTFLFGPKDVPHAFSVDSGPARLLFILSPSGMEGLIRETGELARSLTDPPLRRRSPTRPRWGGSWPSPPGTEGRCWDPRRVGRTAPPATTRRAGLALRDSAPL
jgi:hypothetical protein